MRVWLDDRWFSVVGILEPGELASELDSSAFVGIPLAEALYDFDGSPTTIYVRSDVDYIDDVRAVLGRTANPEDASEGEVTRPSDVLEATSAPRASVTRVLPIAAAPTRNACASSPRSQNCLSTFVFGRGPRLGAGRGPS